MLFFIIVPAVAVAVAVGVASTRGNITGDQRVGIGMLAVLTGVIASVAGMLLLGALAEPASGPPSAWLGYLRSAVGLVAGVGTSAVVGFVIANTRRPASAAPKRNDSLSVIAIAVVSVLGFALIVAVASGTWMLALIMGSIALLVCWLAAGLALIHDGDLEHQNSV